MPRNSAGRRSADTPARYPVWLLMLTGYMAFGRDFSYVGISPLFIGEGYLGYSILRNQRNWIGRFIQGCLDGKLLPLAIAAHLFWGIAEVARASCLQQRHLIEAVRTAAFNYYPLYLLVGIAIGSTLTYAYFVRALKFMTLIISVRLLIAMAAPDALPFSPPGNTSLLPVLLLAAWGDLQGWAWRVPCLLINLYSNMFMGTHGRGTMLGMLAGMGAIAASSRETMVKWCMTGGALIAVLLLVGPYIPGPSGGGPPLDPVVQVARVLASDHPDLAIKLIKWRSGNVTSGGYADELDNLMTARGTAGWREAIWTNAIASLRTMPLKLLGQGEASSLAGLTPDGQDIHTPHNISIYCIYYTGYVGLGIFLLFVYAMWFTGTELKNPRLRAVYSASFWSTLLVAMTGNFLETPFGAVPTYLLLGLIVGVDRKLFAEEKLRLRREAELEMEEHIETGESHAENTGRAFAPPEPSRANQRD
jgi:hypothetical protein